MRREEMPVREWDCDKFVYPKYIAQIAPGAMKLEQWRVKGGVAGTFNAKRGRSVREVWYSLRWTGFDVLSLGYLTDMVLSPLLNLEG